MPPLSGRIGLKDKYATDSTDSTDSKSLADDTFELERPGAEVQEQRQPESRGGQVMQSFRVVFCDDGARGFDFWYDLAVDKEVGPVFPDLRLLIHDLDRHLPFKRYLPTGQFQCQRAFVNGFQESGSEQFVDLHRSADDPS